MTNKPAARIFYACVAIPIRRAPPVRYDDPILETIARSIHTFFPRCLKCGEPIEAFEDADVRIHTKRVVHRTACPAVASVVTQG